MYRHTFTFSRPQKAQEFAEAVQSVLMIWEKREGQDPHEISMLTYTPMDRYWREHYKSQMEDEFKRLQSGMVGLRINERVNDWDPSIAQYFDPGMAEYARTPEYNGEDF